MFKLCETTEPVSDIYLYGSLGRWSAVYSDSKFTTIEGYTNMLKYITWAKHKIIT